VSGSGSRADYRRLTAALSGRAEPIVSMTWQELDDIVGGLPASASDHYPQWWHGDRPNTRAWRRAGYEFVAAEPGRSVTFRRVGSPIADSFVQPKVSAPRRTRPGPSSPSEALHDIDPRQVLLVMTCSRRKACGGQPPGAADSEPWPEALRAARARVLAAADADMSQVMPAGQRYTGIFYQHAEPGLSEAVAGGHVVIISGGYGVVRAHELIGSYDKLLRLGDWPPGLLEKTLIGEARRTGAETAVAFAAFTSSYAQLLRQTPWREAGITAQLVTIADGTGLEALRRLGQAFSAFWNRRHDGYPTGTTIERLH
jgi:hypothetical protein